MNLNEGFACVVSLVFDVGREDECGAGVLCQPMDLLACEGRDGTMAPGSTW